MPDDDALTPLERPLPQRVNGLTPTTLELDAHAGEARITFASFWDILVKRLPTILTATFVVAVLAAIYSYKMTPVYQATGSIEVETDYPQQLQSVNTVYTANTGEDITFLTTQMQILQSDNLAWTTMEQLGLARDPAPDGTPQTPGQTATQIAGARKTAMINDFKGGISVDLVRDTRIINVSYECENPEMAANIVNHLINNYSAFSLQTRYDFTRRASGVMAEQLQDLKAKVEKSQQDLIDYERQNLIVSVGDKETVNDERLQQLNRDYASAESDRVQKESVYTLAKANEAQVGAIATDPVVGHLEEKYADLQATYAEALAEYGPKWPKVVLLHDQLAQMKSLIQDAHKKAIDKLHNEYLAALNRQKLLGDAVTRENGEIGALSHRMIEYNILKRDFEINQQLYQTLLQRLRDATLAVTLQAPNVQVIDQATPPLAPIRPNRRRNIAVGVVVGLILGITLGFVQEALDSSVRSTEEAERLINAPALAVIPSEGDGHRRESIRGGRSLTSAGLDGVGSAVIKRPSSVLAESFRSLRTSVLLSTAPRPPQSMLVTSAQVGEGKTSVTSNLAMSLAQRGGFVLVIDADLRRPCIAKNMGIPNEKGLSSFLTGAHSLDEVLIKYDRVPNLWVLPSGPRPPDPAELLSSHMMETTLKDLSKRFTHIVIDSPPLLLVTDAVVLSAMVDGVILVVSSGATTRGALSRAHRILENAGSRVLGMVLNKVDMRFDSYYGYYYGPYYQGYYDDASGPKVAHSSRGGHAR